MDVVRFWPCALIEINKKTYGLYVWQGQGQNLRNNLSTTNVENGDGMWVAYVWVNL